MLLEGESARESLLSKYWSTEGGRGETRTTLRHAVVCKSLKKGLHSCVSGLSREGYTRERFTRTAPQPGVSPPFTLSHSRSQKSWFATLYLFLTLFEDALWGGEPCPSRTPRYDDQCDIQAPRQTSHLAVGDSADEASKTTQIGRIVATVFEGCKWGEPD